MKSRTHHTLALLLIWVSIGWSQDWNITLSSKMAQNGNVKKIFVFDSSKNLQFTREIGVDAGNAPIAVTGKSFQPASTVYLLQHQRASIDYQLNIYFNPGPQFTLQDPAEHELVVEAEDLFDTVLEIDSVYAVNDFLYNVTTAGDNEHWKLKRNKLQIYFQRNLKLDYCFFLRVNNNDRFQFFYLPASTAKAKKIRTSIRALSSYLESCTVYHFDPTIHLGQIRSTNQETSRECFFYDVPWLQTDSSVTFFVPRGARWQNNYLQLESKEDQFKNTNGVSYSYFKVLSDWKDFIPSFWFMHRKPSTGWTRETLPENGYKHDIDISQRQYVMHTSLSGITLGYLNIDYVFNQQGRSDKKLGDPEKEPLPAQIIRTILETENVRLYSNESLVLVNEYSTLSTAFLTDEGYQQFLRKPNLVFSRRNEPNLRMYLQTVIEPMDRLGYFIYSPN